MFPLVFAMWIANASTLFGSSADVTAIATG